MGGSKEILLDTLLRPPKKRCACAPAAADQRAQTCRHAGSVNTFLVGSTWLNSSVVPVIIECP